MITSAAKYTVEKFASVDEEAIAALLESLRTQKYQDDLVIGNLPPRAFRELRKIDGRYTVPSFLVNRAGAGHLYERRIRGDGMSPESTVDMLRNILTSDDTHAYESWHNGKPESALAAPSRQSPMMIDFSSVHPDNDTNRVSLVTAYPAPKQDLTSRILSPLPKYRAKAARNKALGLKPDGTYSKKK